MKLRNLLWCSIHSFFKTPEITSIPFSFSFSIPFPQTSGLGSLIQITTFFIPDAIILSTHGGVFP